MKRGRKPLLEDQVQGICLQCNVNVQQVSAKSKLGYKKYCKYCTKCLRIKYNLPTASGRIAVYRKTKKPHCERCGFIAVDPCQLDVHHIDRDNTNNELENLITLCSNCHRLEHKEDRILGGR